MVTETEPPEVVAQRAIIAALQRDLSQLQDKVHGYYREEIVIRGDKILMREYCEWFGIDE